MKFELVGTIRWTVGSCGDDRSQGIEVEFDASSDEEAIEKAKAIVQEHHQVSSYLSDYSLAAELRTINPIWKTRFRDEESERSAIPAKPASPAHFEEVRLSP